MTRYQNISWLKTYPVFPKQWTSPDMFWYLLLIKILQYCVYTRNRSFFLFFQANKIGFSETAENWCISQFVAKKDWLGLFNIISSLRLGLKYSPKYVYAHLKVQFHNVKLQSGPKVFDKLGILVHDLPCSPFSKLMNVVLARTPLLQHWDWGWEGGIQPILRQGFGIMILAHNWQQP